MDRNKLTNPLRDNKQRDIRSDVEELHNWHVQKGKAHPCFSPVPREEAVRYCVVIEEMVGRVIHTRYVRCRPDTTMAVVVGKRYVGPATARRCPQYIFRS